MTLKIGFSKDWNRAFGRLALGAFAFSLPMAYFGLERDCGTSSECVVDWLGQVLIVTSIMVFGFWMFLKLVQWKRKK